MDMKGLMTIAFAAITSSGAFAQSTPAKDSKPESKPAEQARPPKDAAATPTDPPAGESAPAKPKAPRPTNPIGDAMCGRDSKVQALAAALDTFEPDAPPTDWPWNTQQVTALRSWLDATECTDASSEEKARYTARAEAIKRLEQPLERGRVVMQVREHLVTVRPPVYQDPEWPASCAPCQTLRGIVDALQAAATPPAAPAASPATPATPAPSAAGPSTIGERLRLERHFDELKGTLCPLKSRASSLESTVRSRFAYFTWTKTGAGVLEAVAVLRRSSFAELCR